MIRIALVMIVFLTAANRFSCNQVIARQELSSRPDDSITLVVRPQSCVLLSTICLHTGAFCWEDCILCRIANATVASQVYAVHSYTASADVCSASRSRFLVLDTALCSLFSAICQTTGFLCDKFPQLNCIALVPVPTALSLQQALWNLLTTFCTITDVFCREFCLMYTPSPTMTTTMAPDAAYAGQYAMASSTINCSSLRLPSVAAMATGAALCIHYSTVCATFDARCQVVAVLCPSG